MERGADDEDTQPPLISDRPFNVNYSGPSCLPLIEFVFCERDDTNSILLFDDIH